MNLEMLAPICLKSDVINFGSPVNRHSIPFWNWVSININNID